MFLEQKKGGDFQVAISTGKGTELGQRLVGAQNSYTTIRCSCWRGLKTHLERLKRDLKVTLYTY